MAEAGPRDDTNRDRIVRFSLTSADPPALAAFYRDVLGFVPGATLRVDAARYGVAGRASVHRLTLGAQAIELVGFDRPGRPYPAGSSSHDGWFQHLALVTHDIDAAWARLRQAAGVSARALEFAILTAARTGEVLGALWTELDLERRVWTVPAVRMKGGREHRVPLSTRG